MKKINRIILLLCAFIFIFGLSACEQFENENNDNGKNNEVYEVGNSYFEEATFERRVYTNVSFENNQSNGTSHDYAIEISSKCQVPIFEYTIESKFYDSDNNLLKTFEKTVTSNIDSDKIFKVACEVSFEIYSDIDRISATFSGKSHKKPTASDSDTTVVNKPIKSIALNTKSKAIELGNTLSLTAITDPVDIDDSIIWSSTNENIVTVHNGEVKAVGIGIAIVKAQAEKGKVAATISVKVIPQSNGYADINKCKAKADSATLTITNKCYNDFLGIPTKSETKTFTATIFKQSSTTFYFISGYENFKKIDGYDHQAWTATDCNGKEYEINSVQHENNLNENYEMAIGSINAYNLGVLPITSRGMYYEDERLFIKDGSTFIETSMYETVAASSPVSADIGYSKSLFGSPVLDSDFDFVGFIVRKNAFTNCADFTAAWAIEKFIQRCGISI